MCIDNVKDAMRPEDDILEQWRRRRRLELVRQKVLDNDHRLLGTFQHLGRPQVRSVSIVISLNHYVIEKKLSCTLFLDKNMPTSASCSFNKHRLIVIIFGKQNQHSFK